MRNRCWGAMWLLNWSRNRLYKYILWKAEYYTSDHSHRNQCKVKLNKAEPFEKPWVAGADRNTSMLQCSRQGHAPQQAELTTTVKHSSASLPNIAKPHNSPNTLKTAFVTYRKLPFASPLNSVFLCSSFWLYTLNLFSTSIHLCNCPSHHTIISLKFKTNSSYRLS